MEYKWYEILAFFVCCAFGGYIVGRILAIVSFKLYLKFVSLRDDIKNKRRAKEVSKWPLIYSCENNGITAVVRAEDFEKAAKEYWDKVTRGEIPNPGDKSVLFVIPNTMIFVGRKEIPAWLSSLCTGTFEDYLDFHAYTREERRTFFVPGSSSLGGNDWQAKNFRRISLDEAYKLVHKDQKHWKYGDPRLR
jgi:hypothetical protein